MADYSLHTERLSVGYNGRPVLERLDFGVNRGELVTLIGPNGAGKSTLLKSLAGQLAPVAGTAYIGKDALADISADALSRRLAVVFTERLRTELMTCRDVVATGRYPYTGRFGILSKEDRKKVAEAMELVQLNGLADADFQSISDGQRQRVMLARAICQETEIILLDEPTSYLDVKHKLEFLSLLQRMAREKKLSVIMSLHELDLAGKVSDKLVCIGKNGVERVGTPREVFVQGYISELFSITAGSFDEASYAMEPEAPKGAPEVFVLAGAGSGRETFRELQRKGIPFATGIIFESDLDYPVARALAANVVSAGACEHIGNKRLQRAKELAASCKRVICCRRDFAPWEPENRELYRELKKNFAALE
ncbi:MAG: ABC transporter ATP-binding protein [Lachnospiraceae bacterium]|nr:ABC transporter ATP-binding protein [Lachnospiraceae bacterium]